MWIELLMKTKQGDIGTQLPVAEGGEVAAKALIDAEVAKEIPEPPSATRAATDAANSVTTLIEKAVNKGFENLTKSLEPSLKKFKQVSDGYELGIEKAMKIPAEVHRYCSIRNFKGPNAAAKAYAFGMFALASAVGGNENHLAVKRLKQMGIPMRKFSDMGTTTMAVNTETLGGVETKAASENLNSDSAFLVPEQIGDDIVDLREKFGVFRQHAKIVPMTSDTRTDPKRKDGVSVVFVGEGAPGTPSDKTWGNIRLTARKLMALTKYSSEIAEDAMINIGDDLAEEFAYAFALKEDQCGFVGDGTATYGGIVGVTQKLLAVDSSISNIKGLVVASGTGYGTNYNSIVLGDFNKVVGTLPEYAEQRDTNCGWFVSKFFWGTVMQKLATAAGGNRVMDILDGARQKSFLGYPVVISQVMPKTSAVNQVCALFGSLRLSTNFGTRREIGIATSNAALNTFEQDQIAMRGTERFDINVHDVGDNATAESAQAGAVAGPIVGLVTASS